MSNAEAPPEQPPQTPNHLTFTYEPPDGEIVQIGDWSPASRDQSPDAVVNLVFCRTHDRETAELWRTELAAGRLPQSSENDP